MTLKGIFAFLACWSLSQPAWTQCTCSGLAANISVVNNVIAASLSWDPVPNATAYQVAYAPEGFPGSLTPEFTTPNYQMSDLMANRQYIWAVRAKCNGVWGPGTTNQYFTTPGTSTCEVTSGWASSTSVTDNIITASLTWDPVPIAEAYQIYYYTSGVSADTTEEFTTASHEISNLLANREYSCVVRVKCAGAWQPWPITSQNFVTPELPLCKVTSGWASSVSVSNNLISASLSWDPVPNAEAYRIRYSSVGIGADTTEEFTSANYEIPNLLEVRQYTWSVWVKCAGAWTSSSTLQGFYTPEVVSCGVTGWNSSMTVTDNVIAASLSWDSIPNVAYQIMYFTSGVSHVITEEFTEPSYEVSDLLANREYSWAVRVKCAGEWRSWPSTFQNFTTPDAVSCEVMSGWAATSSVTNDVITASLTWDPVPIAEAYELAYGSVEGGAVFAGEFTEPTYEISDLVANRQYSWYVRVKCNGVWQQWPSIPQTFTTPGEEACEVISGWASNTSVTNNITTASLSWDSVSIAEAYQIYYYTSGVSADTTEEFMEPNHEISNLLPNREYSWVVRVKCAGVWQPWPTSFNTFTTPPLEVSGFTALLSVTNDVISVVLSWDPLPMAEAYQVTLSSLNTGTVLTEEITAANYEFSNLLTNTVYHWNVRVKYNGEWQPWPIPYKNFSTDEVTCAVTSGWAVSTSVTNDIITAVLSWGDVPIAEAYQLAYNSLPLGTVYTEVFTEANYELSNLLPNQTYKWMVRVKCAGVWQPWPTHPFIQSFETETVDPMPISAFTSPLFNGVITSVRWRTDEAYTSGEGEYKGMYTFSYDEKYQLKEANWANPLDLSDVSGSFRVAGLDYDPNGNILTLRRYDGQGKRIHNFSYRYNSYANINTQKTNRLEQVYGYADYHYNSIGQTIIEEKDDGGDQYIEYDVSGRVRKVFSSQHYISGAFENLKVEYIYDDRGFRLAKVNHEEERTTWYIRDASGNVISVFEQAGIVAYDGEGTPLPKTEPLDQTEVPIYGSGKLGTFYPGQDGSTAYEITDHLGNVRALVRENMAIYTATMEDNGVADITNPRVEESYYFLNLYETEKTDPNMNHTLPAPGDTYVPDKSAYLFWQDGMAGMEASDKSIGPATMLRVNAGDKIEIEAWARYENKASNVRDLELIFLSQFLGADFTNVGGFEGYTAGQTSTALEQALSAAGYADGGDPTRPFAFLNYILFDENMVPVPGGSDFQQVPLEAGFDPGEEALPDQHVRISFDAPVVPQQAGFIYIWVSNESENAKVWFDDVRVSHTMSSVVSQATDYGVWGDVLREQKSDPTVFYKYGYQGQFAEQDEETGWNHFELREYDPVIGRWLVPDPKGQYQSPFIGMGNNPVGGVDPDGAWVKGGGFWRNLFYSDAMVHAKLHANGVNGTKNFKAEAFENDGDAHLRVVNKSNGFTTLSKVANNGTLGSPVGYYQDYRAVFGSPEHLIRMTGGMFRAEAMETFATIYASEVLGVAGGLAIRSGLIFAGRIQIPVYRVFGGGSSMYGKSYSLINPRYVPFYRNFAGLPNANTGQYLLRGYIPLKDIHIGRWFAAPLKGRTGGLPLELYQNFNQLSNPANIILRKPF